MKHKLSKQKNRVQKKQHRSRNIILMVVVVVCVTACAWALLNSPDLPTNLYDAFHKVSECLKQKTDHIVEIVVIIILATIKWFVERFRE